METTHDPSDPDLISRGSDALVRGAWLEARELFERALVEGESPAALEGLGQACWWLDDVAWVAFARERAYQLYRESGDAHGAARVAMALAEDALIFRGDDAVSNGWSERARRLLSGLEPSPEHAILAMRDAFFAFLLAGDMAEARRSANEATELAARFGMFDLEMHARAIEGAARVGEGFVPEGMRILDEATAAATSGEMRDAELIAQTCCWMIYACERVRDFPRAAQWCERVREFSESRGLTSMLGVCRNHHAMVLALGGSWSEAEAELAGAAEQLALRPAQASEGVARLGELRRRQGRYDEAERLFDEVALLPEAQIWRGLLALDLGDHAEAARIAERLLRHLPASDRLRRVHAHEILARALAELGETASARRALVEVEAVAADLGTGPMRAAAALTGGVVALASQEPERARGLSEDAVDLYGWSRLPYEEAEARLLLARCLTALGHTEQARAETGRAASIFARLGAARSERRAVETTGPAGEDRATAALTRREIEILSLVGEGLGDKAIAARLSISEHTVHRHVSNILTKLNAPTRTAAAVQAARLGLL